jgi:succinate dehydrogenase flavin-adding protein (antitoxin of CptAB toxin-antitoxin module)
MKNFNNDFSIDEAIRTLSAYGLEEVQKVLELSDDDIVEILLNNYSVWEQKLINWFINYLNDSAIELNENKYL